jgi:two-component system, LytTR family, response regulator LytT
MRIIIIEDEKLTAEDLAETIKSLEPQSEVVAFLYSVKEAISYFSKNAAPDLIFSDIQLGDGLSFEIFKSVPVSAPVIFCTAYDEYALNAFKNNGIYYILKPFTYQIISDALQKYHILRQTLSGNSLQYDVILDALKNMETRKSASVLVHYKDKILPIKLDEIALFYIENEVTRLLTMDRKGYLIDKNLEEIVQITGNSFFRVNRQCLLNRRAVVDASHYFARKLSVNIAVPFDTPITVSKERTSQFLKWLENLN